eukprot:4659473-Alexandrium_andersonii.AAC.1
MGDPTLEVGNRVKKTVIADYSIENECWPIRAFPFKIGSRSCRPSATFNCYSIRIRGSASQRP